MDEQVQRLVAAVRTSAKYAAIDPGLVARIGAAELKKGRRFKEAVKATKNKLHQVGGAYLAASPKYAAWVDELLSARGEEEIKAVCLKIMSKHISTRERLPFLEEFFSKIFALLPPVSAVVDVACGLNPLALPWMPLEEDASYHACDMYADMIGFLEAFFALDVIRVQGAATVCDVVASPPEGSYDLAFVLKAIPCLEQIDKRAGTRLLDGLDSRYLAISYPAKSLGGQRKGMAETYPVHFEELAAGRGWKEIARLKFEAELVFVVQCRE
ncbi:MAG: hypothetical protein PVI99_10350 [Anaerolineales bacterium]|jgi:16S rRNA (guanine(1405)-N(7))-methyltransferase